MWKCSWTEIGSLFGWICRRVLDLRRQARPLLLLALKAILRWGLTGKKRLDLMSIVPVLPGGENSETRPAVMGSESIGRRVGHSAGDKAAKIRPTAMGLNR